jgi:hypothetical protein
MLRSYEEIRQTADAAASFESYVGKCKVCGAETHTVMVDEHNGYRVQRCANGHDEPLGCY